MSLSNLTHTNHRKPARRVGRGIGSGMGKTSTRGVKGQNARSGGGVRPGFEGGQTPIYRRLGKFGFNNKVFRVEYAPVNIGSLKIFDDGTVVTQALLVEKHLVAKNKLVKILGNGTLTKKLEVHADKFSAAAKKAIEDQGGQAIVDEKVVTEEKEEAL